MSIPAPLRGLVALLLLVYFICREAIAETIGRLRHGDDWHNPHGPGRPEDY